VQTEFLWALVSPLNKTLLYIDDIQEPRDIKHLRIHDNGGKLRYLPLHPVAA
jgi:hypothetical protein